jgi:hypothetical protein
LFFEAKPPPARCITIARLYFAKERSRCWIAEDS